MHILDYIIAFGYIGITFVVFAESGLAFGFFFPGDSLLFTAGFMASQGLFSIWILTPLIVCAAILGDNFGYWFGLKIGPKIFNRPDSFWFNAERLSEANKFFVKYGAKSIFLARFMPAIRTFTPIAAGMAKMNYSKFLVYNISGGIIWGAGFVLGGFFLGSVVPNADSYVLIIVVVIILLSFIPITKEIKNIRKKK